METGDVAALAERVCRDAVRGLLLSWIHEHDGEVLGSQLRCRRRGKLDAEPLEELLLLAVDLGLALR